MSRWAADARPHVVIVGGGFGGLYAARALAGAAGPGHPARPPQPPPLPAPALPGGHRGAQPGRHRHAPALDPARGRERHRPPGRGRVGRPGRPPPRPRRRPDDLRLARPRRGRDPLLLRPRRLGAARPGPQDASRTRSRSAAACCSPSRRPSASRTRRRARALLTFVVVGGGPTGVELAGALAEIARADDARATSARIDPTQARIILLEGGAARSRRLTRRPARAGGRRSSTALGRRGAHRRDASRAIDADGGLARRRADPRAHRALGRRRRRLAARPARSGVPLDRAGRVLVEPDLSIPGHPEVFVDRRPLRARRAGRRARPRRRARRRCRRAGTPRATSCRAIARRADRAPFRYRDKGSLATIGRAAAVADVGRLQLSGLPRLARLAASSTSSS